MLSYFIADKNTSLYFSGLNSYSVVSASSQVLFSIAEYAGQTRVYPVATNSKPTNSKIMLAVNNDMNNKTDPAIRRIFFSFSPMLISVFVKSL